MASPIAARVEIDRRSYLFVTLLRHCGRMDALLQTLHGLVAEHRLLVCVILAVVTLLEALMLVGVLIPIMAVMLTAGALIATGSLHPVEVIAWCSLGAAIGVLLLEDNGRG
jgi:membrane protein DedA with SNARE-associated domain